MTDCNWPKSEELFLQLINGRSVNDIARRLQDVTSKIELVVGGNSWPKSETEFIKWFWKKNNGYEILEKLKEASDRKEKAWPKSKREFLAWFWEGYNGLELVGKLQESKSPSIGTDSWPENEYQFVSTWYWRNDNGPNVFRKLCETHSVQLEDEDTASPQNENVENMTILLLKEYSKQFRDVCDEIEQIYRNQIWPKDEDDFLAWFWSGDHGNNLIKKLNRVPGQSDRIRREKIIPKIYAVVIDNKPIEISGQTWKLCKVGSTGREGGERVAGLMDQIKTSTFFPGPEPDPRKIFELPISAIDTAPLSHTEKKVRIQVGDVFDKKEAKKFNLPAHTEWVCATVDHLQRIERELKKFEMKGKDSIDFFMGNENVIPPKTPPEIYELIERLRTTSIR